MKKLMCGTVKKMQTLFVRRKSKNTGDGNSNSHSEDERLRNVEIDRLMANKERHNFSGDNSTESSPEPIEILSSSDEEDYISRSRKPGRDRRKTRIKISEPIVDENGDNQEGACGPLVKENKTPSPLLPVNGGQQVVPYNREPENSCKAVVLTSCGELEKTCTTLSLELQAKVTVIKETLLREYPPFYDFCIIASDNDYDEAIQFKEYVASTFGLAGCTLDDGFVSLGADLFECYKMMMDHSTKVFFFVTENFTKDSFCKRIQSGAVFSCLMSKAQKDKEKCVPVFPHGFCLAPLALSGISGLNPIQREVTRRSIDNTYSPLLRERRVVWDRENYQKRCLEFHVQVSRCIEEAKSEMEMHSVQNDLSIMNVSENGDPVIQENKSTSVETPISSLSIENKKYEIKSERSKKEEFCLSQEKVSEKNTESVKTKKVECDQISNNDDEKEYNSDVDGGDISGACEDVLKQSLLSDNDQEITNNTVSSVSITDSASVHVGNTYNIVINQASSIDMTHLEQLIKTAKFSGKKTPEEHADESG